MQGRPGLVIAVAAVVTNFRRDTVNYDSLSFPLTKKMKVLLEAITEILGEGSVITSPGELDRYAADWSGEEAVRPYCPDRHCR